MTPTNKLRFVERKSTAWEPADMFQTMRTIKVLQQWWAIERDGQITPTGEWRDIPLEKVNE